MATRARRPIDDLTPDVIAAMTPAQKARLAQIMKRRASTLGIKPRAVPWGTEDPKELLRRVAPRVVFKGFSREHDEIWEWVWGVEPGVRPTPLVVVMPRGRGKSSSLELASALLLAHGRRRFVWYVSRTQDLADAHVEAINAIFEMDTFSTAYPYMRPKIGKFGNQKAWRRQRLMAEGPGGLAATVEAVGLDTGTRGIKAEFQRPDLIILDDIDSESDSHDVVLRKLSTLTQAVIPAGSDDAALVFVQNMVHANSLIRRVVEPEEFEKSERLISRCKIVGPVPAVLGLRIELLPDPANPKRSVPTITAGTPTWSGQSIEALQALLDSSNIRAFMIEMQHGIQPRPGKVFSHIDFRRCTEDEVPWGEVIAKVVAVDPAVTEADGSDSTGIQLDALTADGEIYRLWSWERVVAPTVAVETAILKAVEHRCEHVVIESNQGGDTWNSVFREAMRNLEQRGEIAKGSPRPKLMYVKVGGKRSKVERAQAMVPDYDRGVIVHVIGDTTPVLEAALYRFPVTAPLDLTDAATHSWRYLRRIRKAPQVGNMSVGGGATAWANPASKAHSTVNTREAMDLAARRDTRGGGLNLSVGDGAGDGYRWRVA